MRPEVAASLDEIEAAQEKLKDRKLNPKTAAKLKAWIRKHRAYLRSIGYKGKK